MSSHVLSVFTVLKLNIRKKENDIPKKRTNLIYDGQQLTNDILSPG